jgi:very-short-patch-repair endonuclease
MWWRRTVPHDIVPRHQRKNAKTMRRAMTEAELKLWNELRAHRLMDMGFRRQVPIGPYIADFACPAHSLIVEVDGSQHGEAEQTSHDEKRTAYLQGRCWTIIRFWNDDILRDIDGVCQHIITVAGLDVPDRALPTSPFAREHHS